MCVDDEEPVRKGMHYDTTSTYNVRRVEENDAANVPLLLPQRPKTAQDACHVDSFNYFEFLCRRRERLRHSNT